MASKKMTHAGKVQIGRQDESTETWLRETPKFWTDGDLRWPKFYRGSALTQFTYAKKSYGYTTYTLDLTTIRPLTVEDQRIPLQKDVDYRRKHVSRLEEELQHLKVKLADAKKGRDRAFSALSLLDKEHGIDHV